MGTQVAKHPTASDPAFGHVAVTMLLVLVLLIVVIGGNIVILAQLGSAILPVLGLADLFLVPLLFSPVPKLMSAADAKRRAYKYEICADDYIDAPQHIKKTMHKIFKSAQALRDNRAHSDGMLGDLDIDRVLYTASEQAVQAAELNRAKRKLQAASGRIDEDALRSARAMLRKIGGHLDEVDADLSRAATAANDLASKIVESERARKQVSKERQTAEHRAQERSAARSGIDAAVMRVQSASRIDTGGIGDRVASVAAGYDDATKITNKVLGHESSETNEQQPSLLESAWKPIRSVVNWVIKP